MITPCILNLDGENTVALAVTTDGRKEDALEPGKVVKLREVQGVLDVELME